MISKLKTNSISSVLTINTRRQLLNNTLHHEILSDIESIRKKNMLFSEKSFDARVHAMDFLEFHVIDRIESLVERNNHFDNLKQQALKVKGELEEITVDMFRSIRLKISQEHIRGKDFLKLANEYLEYDFDAEHANEGYDHLDLFLNGLLTYRELPDETIHREPEMVFFQKTPARILMQLIESASIKPADVFFDIGAGLGQSTMMFHLMTSIVSKGIEIEPAFCDYANRCAAELNLTNVEFIHADARDADYSAGTLFFMYTPFEGNIMNNVLQKLKKESMNRRIRIFTYGPCTAIISKQDWLKCKNEVQDFLKEAGEFESVSSPSW